MGYPGSITTFGTKNAGDTIQPAHVNDLQTEVTALETGLLSGLQHPLAVAVGGITQSASTGGNSFAGPSTVASLSVTGGSTFTSRPVMPPPDVARVAVQTKQDLANDSTVAINWTTDVILTNASMHSTVTNPDRLSPVSTGIWVMAASIQLTNRMVVGASTANFRAQIEDSSGGVLARQHVADPGGSPNAVASVTLFAMKRIDSVAASPWVRVVASQHSASTNSIDSTHSFFHLYKL